MGGGRGVMAGKGLKSGESDGGGGGRLKGGGLDGREKRGELASRR